MKRLQIVTVSFEKFSEFFRLDPSHDVKSVAVNRSRETVDFYLSGHTLPLVAEGGAISHSFSETERLKSSVLVDRQTIARLQNTLAEAEFVEYLTSDNKGIDLDELTASLVRS